MRLEMTPSSIHWYIKLVPIAVGRLKLRSCSIMYYSVFLLAVFVAYAPFTIASPAPALLPGILTPPQEIEDIMDQVIADILADVKQAIDDVNADLTTTLSNIDADYNMSGSLPNDTPAVLDEETQLINTFLLNANASVIGAENKVHTEVNAAMVQIAQIASQRVDQPVIDNDIKNVNQTINDVIDEINNTVKVAFANILDAVQESQSTRNGLRSSAAGCSASGTCAIFEQLRQAQLNLTKNRIQQIVSQAETDINNEVSVALTKVRAEVSPIVALLLDVLQNVGGILTGLL